MKYNFRILFIITMMLLTFTASCFFTYAAEESLTIQMKINSNQMLVNGKTKTVPKAYLKNNVVYVPLRPLMEVLGGEITWIGQGKLNVTYRDHSLDLTVGSKKIELNKSGKTMSAPPVVQKGSTMVPLEFIHQYFWCKATYQAAKNMITIIQTDDGSLTDLSFLTDGIGKPKVGNSYFGWSIIVPKGSRMDARTFNSKHTSITNPELQINLEMSVYPAQGKKLEDWHTNLSDDPESYVSGEILDANLDLDMEMAEYFVAGRYGGASYVRLYTNEKYAYLINITSEASSDPEKVKGNPQVKAIMDSFYDRYSGGEADVEDLSTVKFGLATYDHYISYSGDKRYLGWEVDVFPEWDVMSSSEDGPFNFQIGSGNKEYIGVQMDKSSKELLDYAGEIKEAYDKKFNSKYYTFVEEKLVDIAGETAYQMIFTMKSGNIKYYLKETIIKKNELFYDITLKVSEALYQKKTPSYEGILSSFKISEKNTKELIGELESYQFEENKKRVGKVDDLVEIQDKSKNWKIKLPGNWMRSYSYGNNNQMYSDPMSGVMVSIDMVEITSQNKEDADKEKFSFMKNISEDKKVKLIKQESFLETVKAGRLYHYRWADEDADIFADVKSYVLDAEKNSYAVTIIIPDVSSSEYHLKLTKDIWDSFVIEESKTEELPQDEKKEASN